jgi:hypothetical protein
MARTITRNPNRAAKDETEAPSRRAVGRSRGETSESSGSSNVQIADGWDAFDAFASETASGEFAEDFDAGEDATIIKILTDRPLSYKQHWVDEITKGKRSFVCLGDGDCPLCDDLGNKPRAMACFTIVEFSNPDKPSRKVLRQGPMVTNILKKFAEDEKTKPINKPDLYFAISKEKVNKKWTYSVLPVKQRDLLEDYDVEPLTEAELDDFAAEPFERDQIIKATPRTELVEVVEKVLD